MFLLRDPLFQFIVIGAALFALAGWLQPPAISEIHVPPSLQGEARERWIDEQLMIAEARRRGLDRGDSIVERQLQQRLRLAIEARADDEAPDDAVLRQWLTEHGPRYAPPARVDLEQIVFTRSRYGQQAEAAAREALGRLRAGQTLAVERLDAVSALELRKDFGQDFAAAAWAQETSWSQPIASGLGWHLVRILRRLPAAAPDFASLRPRLLADWRQARREALFQEQLQALRERYRIVDESA